MRITNLNPDSEIGASSWLVELDGCRLLMDAGMHPKREGRDALPLYKFLDDKDLDAIAISHCHHDHIGSLPVAMRHSRKAQCPDDRVELLCGRARPAQLRQRHAAPAGGARHPGIPAFHPRPSRGTKPNSKASGTIARWIGPRRKARAGSSSPTLEFFDAGHTSAPPASSCADNPKPFSTPATSVSTTKPSCNPPASTAFQADVLIMETTRGNRAPAGIHPRKGNRPSDRRHAGVLPGAAACCCPPSPWAGPRKSWPAWR
jgi:hypothetical protein